MECGQFLPIVRHRWRRLFHRASCYTNEGPGLFPPHPPPYPYLSLTAFRLPVAYHLLYFHSEQFLGTPSLHLDTEVRQWSPLCHLRVVKNDENLC